LTKTDVTIANEHQNPAMGRQLPGAIRGVLMFFYCLGILLLLDLLYSNFIYKKESRASARIANSMYHHDLTTGFSGYDTWGGYTYRLYTNSLGFKDGSPRIVSLVGDRRRVLLMGDSFTEGVGVRFEETFAGLLYRSGLERVDKVEFLNGGVVGYSPVIYYRKIKHLLESGLRFDEVVVFPDQSDVADEATHFFCVDEDPRYNAYCSRETIEETRRANRPPHSLARNFIVADRIRQTAKKAIRRWRHPMARDLWPLPGVDLPLPPLGVEGGIARALSNMQKLADLLAEYGIPLTLVVYPWPNQIFYDDRESRQIAIWRAFCVKNCQEFINLFPAFFAEKDVHKDWYDRLYIHGDAHFSPGGHELMFRELARHLL
jgi:lysophospholipase L1-like esterase